MTKINVLGMLAAGPVDLRTGQPIDLIRLLDGGSPLRVIVPDRTGAMFGTLANRAVTDAALGRALVMALMSVPADAAASHLVDETGQELLRAGRYEDFLARRGTALTALIKTHIDRMAEWGARDGRSVSDLMRTVA
jgi:hypothetical protein